MMKEKSLQCLKETAGVYFKMNGMIENERKTTKPLSAV